MLFQSQHVERDSTIDFSASPSHCAWELPPVCAEHRFVCGTVTDVSGTYGLSCRKMAGRLARHNAVNELIRRTLLTAGIHSRLEPTNLSYKDDKRPDGVTIMPWSRGRCAEWDFTCYRVSRVTGSGEVASEAERKKSDKYTELTAMYYFPP